MKVLVVETEPHAAATAAAQLEMSGHQIERCHEPDQDASAFPCIGLSSGRCPVEDTDIDVVLTVRGPSHPSPAPLEDGVTCALRRRLPVVVAGRTSTSPFDRYHVAVANQDVVGACERAAAGRQIQHEAVAGRALDWTLRHRDLPLDAARADVRRHDGGLQVTLFVPAETPNVVRDMAIVRVAGALRAFDTRSSRIDVTCKVNA